MHTKFRLVAIIIASYIDIVDNICFEFIYQYGISIRACFVSHWLYWRPHSQAINTGLSGGRLNYA